MASLHPQELDSSSTAADSVASSPRSDHNPHDGILPRVRFMCSFGGKILPRPHDNQLRYVGGDTRIVAVHRSTTFSVLISKLSKLSGKTSFSFSALHNRCFSGHNLDSISHQFGNSLTGMQFLANVEMMMIIIINPWKFGS